jgi:hypothetical protein
MITYKQLEKNIENDLLQMVRRAHDFRGLFNRVLYPMFKKAQLARWSTENSSEGQKWAPLNAKYREYKLDKFKESPPYNGTKMLIATNRLIDSVIGPSADHRKIVEPKRLIISTTVPYAKYVNEKRNFTHFGRITENRILNVVRLYVMKNKVTQ